MMPLAVPVIVMARPVDSEYNASTPQCTFLPFESLAPTLTPQAGQSFVREAAMAKLYASQVAERVASRAVEWVGGVGFTKDFPLEKFYRDCKIGKCQCHWQCQPQAAAVPLAVSVLTGTASGLQLIAIS